MLYKFFTPTILSSTSISQEVKLLIIGAVFGAALGLAVDLLKLLSNNFGRFNIYKKIVRSKFYSNACMQIVREGSKSFIQAPLWLEVINTKNKPIIMRNISVRLFNRGVPGTVLKQINYSSDSREEERTSYGADGWYTLVIPPRSCMQTKLYFLLKENDEVFDALYFQYYSTLKPRNIKLADFPDGWKSTNKYIDDEWVKIK